MASDPKIDSVNMKVCNDENIHDVKQTFVHDTAASQGPSDLNNFDLKANNLQTPKSDISSKLNTKEQVRQVLDTLAIKDSPLLKSMGLVGRAERLIEKKLKAFVGEGGAQVGDSGHAEVELRLKPSAKVPQAKSRPLNPLMLENLKAQIKEWLKEVTNKFEIPRLSFSSYQRL